MPWWKFSKVSLLLDLLFAITIELTFENLAVNEVMPPRHERVDMEKEFSQKSVCY